MLMKWLITYHIEQFLNNVALTKKIGTLSKASNVDENGSSLNDCLEIGQNLIDLIPIVLTNYTIYAVALSSDKEKAFLKIRMDPEDLDFLRFLWWKKRKIVQYRHCRVISGVCCSQFLLSMWLNNLWENSPGHLNKIA